MGFPYYNKVIESLNSTSWYTLIINVESVSYDERIIPIIYVPADKGKIITDFELKDYNGNVSLGKPVKMLGFEFSQVPQTFQVEYCSMLGLLSVFYECDYFDSKRNLHKREASSTHNPNFAMARQVINDHTVRYHCKSPVGDSFDAMVFTVEWNENNVN